MNKLNKIIAGGLVIGTLFVLSGCSPKYEDVSGRYASKPEALKDCTFTRLSSNEASNITVVRCPNSDTTTRTSGKSPITTVVIEDTINVNGVEYIKK
jgi:hypothetical protein